MSAVSMFFTLAMVRFLRGHRAEGGVDALWDKLLERVPPRPARSSRTSTASSTRSSFVPKDYAEHSETIDDVVQALVRGTA